MSNSQPFFKKQTDKLHYLDGMRGLMAINVILCHFICVYYPQMYFQNATNEDSGFLSLFASTPLTILANGNIAVAYFMVLTGFLVGMSSFAKETFSIRFFSKKAITRYTRLLPVVLITTLITWVMMKLNLQWHLQISDPMVNVKFLQGYCNFEPSLWSLFKNCFIKPFVLNSDYVGPFWTIRYEFLGYILVLFLANILKKSRYRRIFYIGATILIFVLSTTDIPVVDTTYTLFIMGLFAADLNFNKNPTVCGKFYEKHLDRRTVTVACCVLGIYFSCCTMFDTPLYSWWFNLPMINGNSILLRGMGIMLLMHASTRLKKVQTILSWRPFLILGRYSFETYAIHWPLMLSLEAFLFVVFRQSMPYHAAALLAFLITIPVIYAASIALQVLIKNYSKMSNVIKARTLPLKDS